MENLQNTINYFDADYISRSELADILDMPKKQYIETHINKNIINKTTDAMNFGTACHLYLLENDQFDNEVAVYSGSTRRTKAYKEFYEQNIDKIVLIQDEFNMLKSMQKAISEDDICNGLIDGILEQAIYIKNSKYKLKCKPDIYNNKLNIVCDLKTTAKIDNAFYGKLSNNKSYAIQAYMYQFMTKIKYKLTVKPTFKFLFVDKTPYSNVKLITASEDYINWGKMLFQKAMQLREEYIKDIDNNVSNKSEEEFISPAAWNMKEVNEYFELKGVA
jgi:hypothetical protein